jgi:hypothetical protein
MIPIPFILADSEDELPIKLIIGVIVLIFWGIGALAKVAKQSAQKQKERLKQVREAIERSQQAARQRSGQPMQQPPRPVQQPVALAPEIARRIPKYTPAKVPQQRRPQPQQRRPVSTGRPATNYNAMAQQPKKQRSKAKAPPPLPTAPVAALEAPVKVTLAEEASPAVTSRSSKKPVTVGASAIRRWMRPQTLRQQFILTEVLQPPLAMRENPLD